MLFDVFIFLVPILISIIVYILSFYLKHNKIWTYMSFIVSFLFIFSVTLIHTNQNDMLAIKNEIEEILTIDNDDTVLENKVPTTLASKHTNPIIDYSYSKEKKGAEDIIKITYKEKLFNGVILLQNRFYIIQ